MIVGIYLFVPIIGKSLRSCNEKDIQYFLLIWFFVLIFNLPYLSKYKPTIDLTSFIGYIGYLVLGYYLSIKSFKNPKKLKIVSIVLIAIGVLTTQLGTYFLSKKSNSFNSTFFC